MMSRLWAWLFWEADWIPLGPLAPYVLGLSLGRMPHKVKGDEE